ncbi:unnamed protein product, partial [Gulo gulo]
VILDDTKSLKVTRTQENTVPRKKETLSSSWKWKTSICSKCGLVIMYISFHQPETQKCEDCPAPPNF